MIVDSVSDLRHASLGSDAWQDGFRFKRCVKNLS
jgi:hypothetical protein